MKEWSLSKPTDAGWYKRQTFALACTWKKERGFLAVSKLVGFWSPQLTQECCRGYSCAPEKAEKSHMFVDQELLPKHNIELFRGLNRSERQERFGSKNNKDVFNVFCVACKTVFKFEPCVSSKHAKETWRVDQITSLQTSRAVVSLFNLGSCTLIDSTGRNR